MKVYCIRLPDGALQQIDNIAKKQFMLSRTLCRVWIMQRLEEEMNVENKNNE